MNHQTIFEIQSNLCRTMSHQLRLEIVHLLRAGPRRVQDIATSTGCSQSMVSRHLGVLRHGGILVTERHGQEIFYQVANPKILTICDLMRDVLVEEISRQSELIQGDPNEHHR
ncbi:MAG: helix-turn-helix transcriptional regulator [Anaerolineales bacterium]|nr:helix-turn-helix transcriptional regulator [Anaerolineales bacterium]